MATKRKVNNSRIVLCYGLGIFLILAAFVCFLPKILLSWSVLSLGVEKSNEIGDTIGGIMGPAVGLIGGALTFLAFWAQYNANAEQRRQFIMTVRSQNKAEIEERRRHDESSKELEERRKGDIERQNKAMNEQREQFERVQELQRNKLTLQDKRARIDLFESKFYTMLTIHRDNVKDIDLGKDAGRKVFLLMYDELKFMYWTVKEVCQSTIIDNKLTDEEIYQLAYLSFFFGIGEKSTPLVVSLAGERLGPIVLRIHETIKRMPCAEKPSAGATTIAKDTFTAHTPGGDVQWIRKYRLGEGHLRRLSHYIRHIFQIVKLVDEQESDTLTYEDKYKYLSNLRAQLSAPEQLFIYYNALSVLGEPWLVQQAPDGENYIEKYCLIKSIPLNMADFYKTPDSFLKLQNSKGKPVFEWTEIQNRMSRI